MAKLAIVSSGDPLNVATWSGTPYHATKALQKRYPNLMVIRQARPRWFEPVRRAGRRLSLGRIDITWDEALARRHAMRLARYLRRQQVDAAICIGISPLAAFLGEDMPVIHVSDATAALMLTTYREFGRLIPRLGASANQLDKAAILHARACLFATPWAARSAINDYNADPALVHVVPLGANIESAPAPGRAVRQDGEVCNLVFLGMDWQRKRGDLAVQTVMELASRGISVKLDIIGTVPPAPVDPDLVKIHGFVSKSTPKGRALFHSIMAQGHFLLVPTRHECFGVFAAEANAFGMPVISTKTGGLPGVVIDGINGYLLPPEAGAGPYADRIAAIWRDAAQYEALRGSALARFRTVLNWDAWLTAAAEIIDRTVCADAGA